MTHTHEIKIVGSCPKCEVNVEMKLEKCTGKVPEKIGRHWYEIPCALCGVRILPERVVISFIPKKT